MGRRAGVYTHQGGRRGQGKLLEIQGDTLSPWVGQLPEHSRSLHRALDHIQIELEVFLKVDKPYLVAYS
jgi:hypothetical protein